MQHVRNGTAKGCTCTSAPDITSYYGRPSRGCQNPVRPRRYRIPDSEEALVGRTVREKASRHPAFAAGTDAGPNRPDVGCLIRTRLVVLGTMLRASKELREMRKHLKKENGELKVYRRRVREGERLYFRMPFRKHVTAHLEWFEIRMDDWERYLSLVPECQESEECTKLYSGIAMLLNRMRSELLCAYNMEAINRGLMLYLARHGRNPNDWWDYDGTDDQDIAVVTDVSVSSDDDLPEYRVPDNARAADGQWVPKRPQNLVKLNVDEWVRHWDPSASWERWTKPRDDEPVDPDLRPSEISADRNGDDWLHLNPFKSFVSGSSRWSTATLHSVRHPDTQPPTTASPVPSQQLFALPPRTETRLLDVANLDEAVGGEPSEWKSWTRRFWNVSAWNNAENRSDNSEYRSENSQYRSDNSEYRTENSEYRSDISEHRSDNSQYRSRDSQYRSYNSKTDRTTSRTDRRTAGTCNNSKR